MSSTAQAATHRQQPSSVLSDSDWQALFPKAFYTIAREGKSGLSAETVQAVKNNGLKYLIAIGQSDKGIRELIDQLKGKNSPQLHSTYTQYELTAVHVAVLKQRKAVVIALIEAGASFDTPDKYGWTPLHHAALCSDEIFELLIQRGASTERRTKVGGTPHDLRRLVGVSQDLFKRTMLFQPADGPAREMSLDELQQRFHLHYREACYWPIEMHKILWRSEPEPSQDTLTQHQIKTIYYPRLQQKPPTFVLREEGSKLALGLAAGETIAPYTLLGEYAGNIVVINEDELEQVVEFTYSFHLETRGPNSISTDATNQGNLLKYMNDGWPNCYVHGCYNWKGQRSSRVIFACEEVPAGQPLVYDYSALYHTLKWGTYVLREQDKMRAFLKNFYPQFERATELMSSLVRKGTYTLQELLDFRFLESRVLFPFHTPSALMDLVFSETLEPSAILAFMEREESNSESLMNDVRKHEVHYQRLKTLLKNLIALNASLTKLGHRASPIREQLLQKINLISVPKMCELIEVLNASLLDEAELHRILAGS